MTLDLVVANGTAMLPTGSVRADLGMNNNGGTTSHVAIAEIDYGLTDTIALTVNLPFIASKYTGPPVYFVGGVETHPGPLDDGTYHGAFQDFRVDVRRLFWAGPIPSRSRGSRSRAAMSTSRSASQ